MKKTILALGLILLTAVACAAPRSVSIPIPEPAYWPTDGWQAASPESQGMDSDALADVLAGISAEGTAIHSVLVIRNGYLVTESYFHPYTRESKVHIQSVTKSVIGALLGAALEDGSLESTDLRLLELFPDREIANPSEDKSGIRLEHLLAMSSGLDCREFSGGPVMEGSEDWVGFMLDLPAVAAPGKQFGYCNGNAHLLSAVLTGATGMSAREYANRTLFAPLGIPAAAEADWGADPQGVTFGGYGLHLRPVDLAKLAFLFLHNGAWAGEEILPADWVAAATAEHVRKEDGSGYGYLWTVYPDSGRYAALGLGGQQIHVIPSENLVVIVTAALEAFAEAPEIETMLSAVRSAIRSEAPLPENAEALERLQGEIERAANPALPVAALPELAADVSGHVYRFDESPLGWSTLSFVFEPGSPVAQVVLDGVTLDVGLDNLYRLTEFPPDGDLLARGRWRGINCFVLDYPYPIAAERRLGELGMSEFQFAFIGHKVAVAVVQLVFGAEPITFIGTR